MNSYPHGTRRPIGPYASDDTLTDEQRVFATALGGVLAELWARQHRPSAPGETHHSEGSPHPGEGAGLETPPNGG